MTSKSQRSEKGWPSPQDYNEAVQNLATAFTDPELKSGEAELSSIGLPKPITGAFASVYRVNTNGSSWALRCFLHNQAEQRERYFKISEHLKKIPQPYTVPFEYQEQGVLIHGRTFPILKMQWVDGVHLNQYLANHKNDAKVLEKLCSDWKEMLAWMHASGVAHGDLQHSNIIVKNNKLQLVDYDGIFVPQLMGHASNELGHRNYQHPTRSTQHFGPWLDNFSAWSIYTSLRCLSIDPGLWDKLSAGEESLLFQQRDYEDTRSSKAFFMLEQHRSEEVQDCGRFLRYLLATPLDAIPFCAIEKS